MKWLKRTLHWSLCLCGLVTFLPLTTVQASDSSYTNTDNVATLAQAAREQSFGDRASRNVYSPDSSGTAIKPTITPIESTSSGNNLLAHGYGVDADHLNFGDNGYIGPQEKLTPLNFGQFLIGQLTLAEYSSIWQTISADSSSQFKCSLHYRDNSFIASGLQCISYFNYVEAHADEKGVLSSISVAGDQPVSQTTEEVIGLLGQRYVPLAYDDLPDSLKKVADLRMDLCSDLGKLMEGKYQCEEYWFQFRNFYLVFSPSIYRNTRKEQFTYGTLHHFVDYESMMVKRRLAVVRQELSVKKEIKAQK